MSRNNEMQSDKVNIVASVITVSRMYFSCNKRTRREMSIDFFHVALTSVAACRF